ncbi:hypothetical protein [Staphylococcus shinii]|uniref:hypothetical protein n=1 Tax=Staphylococcus shinii TaxID=2912228 RepID=UPI003F853A31
MIEDKAYTLQVLHHFTYEIKVNNQIVYTNRNISTQASANQVSINDWLKHHNNYSMGHETYES